MMAARFLMGKNEKKVTHQISQGKKKRGPLGIFKMPIVASNSFFKMPCFLQKKYFHLIT
jgi:hypothetical protein